MKQGTVRSRQHSLFLLLRTFLPQKLFSNIKINNQKRSISDREDPQMSPTTNVISKNTLGGRSGNRTHTPLLELDFESGASTNSAIRP